MSKSIIELCKLEIPTVNEKIASLFDASLKCCSLQTHFQYYEVCTELSAVALLKTGNFSLLQILIEFTSVHLLPVLVEYAETIALFWKCMSDIISQSDTAFLHISNLHMEHIFKTFLPQSLSLSDRFTLLAVMDFLISAIQFQGSRMWSENLFSSIGQDLCYYLVNGIGGKMVPSILPKISDVLLKLTIAYPDQVRVWFHAIIFDLDFAPVVSQQDKRVFINCLLGTRQIRKHRDLVKAFSIKCRGLENTEFANSL